MRVVEFTNEHGSTVYIDLTKITHIVSMELTTRAYFDGGDWVELPQNCKRIIDAWKIHG